MRLDPFSRSTKQSASDSRPSPPLARGGLGTLLLIGLFLAGWWYSTSYDGTGELVQFSGATMGTTYTIKIRQLPNDKTSDELQAEVDRILAQVNRQMSTYDRESELSRFNRTQSTDWVAVSPELLAVVKAALRISRLTDGAFDITIGPVVNLWGFGSQMTAGELPSDEAVKNALAKVGYERVHTRNPPPALRKERPDIYIDLSAIAKGYGVDKIAQYLESLGIAHYLVEIGGELRGKGLNPNGVSWRIAIEKPDPGQRVIERIVQISDKGVATSGDYRNFFEIAGQRYSHAMDPRTGRPVRHDLASVTVMSDTCMEADALATALLVMGPEQGFRLAQNQGIEAFFIVINPGGFTEKSTSGFERYVVD